MANANFEPGLSKANGSGLNHHSKFPLYNFSTYLNQSLVSLFSKDLQVDIAMFSSCYAMN